MIRAIKDIIRQDLIETYCNFFGRKQLIEEKTIQNFEVLSKKHNEIVEHLSFHQILLQI